VGIWKLRARGGTVRGRCLLCIEESTGCPTCYRIRLAGGPLLRVATIRNTIDTFLFISRTMNVLLFKFCCNIFIGVRIIKLIKQMPGSVASGTHYIFHLLLNYPETEMERGAPEQQTVMYQQGTSTQEDTHCH
jgi:hypothetical protein